MENIGFGFSSIVLLNILFYLIGILIFIFLLRIALRINQRTELQLKQNKLLELIAEKLGVSKDEINKFL
jgi:hypothetical protein